MSDPKHIACLDGWRGAAIAALLLGHFYPVPGINFGTLGVNLFFVLSGLLMTRILFVQKQPLGLFYRRRVARIFPSVYVFLAVTTLAFVVAGRELSMLELLSAATFTNNYIVPDGPWRMPVGHIWSLSVEEHAYVLLSLLAVLTRASHRRSVRAVGAATAAISLVALLYAWTHSGAALSRLWLHSEVSAFGIFASSLVFLAGLGERSSRWDRVAVPVLLVVGIAAHWWSAPAPLRLLLGCGAFALAMKRLQHAPQAVIRMFEFAPLRQLGVWSFSLYLWQQPFYQLVRHEGMHPALGLGLSLVVGALAHYLVEKPARAWLNAHWGKPAPGVQAQRMVG
ncbi:acyltransferase family protein [Massilia brevitalea]|uniref:acyltransferase family protein n=1 Tax=Massilia brevitalea TaxID=442526 RepID=UPI00273A4480|nr:acyltransferase [Massilia brevitalea]